MAEHGDEKMYNGFRNSKIQEDQVQDSQWH